MTEWNASDYYEQSALQKWVAEKCLASLALVGSERVLDVGCGDGKITAEIAARLPLGSIVGVDPSTRMIAFAREHFGGEESRAEFAVGDATRLPYRDEFDLVVSFNALHWVSEQEAALGCIAAALRRGGRSLLQFVSRGERQALEDIIEATRASPRWSRYFGDYRKPYAHFTPEEYGAMAERAGLRIERIDTVLEAWDFGSRQGFADFAHATFVEWTRMIPAAEGAEFIGDVLDRYRQIGDGSPADANVFHFYQMKVQLRRQPC